MDRISASQARGFAYRRFDGMGGARGYRVAADLVLLVHFAFVLVAVFGAFGVLLSIHWVWVHVPIVLWSSVVNLMGWTCPLTPLEKRFSRAAGLAPYQGGFVQHYVGAIIYPKGNPRSMELAAGFWIVVWNLLVYALLGWFFLA